MNNYKSKYLKYKKKYLELYKLNGGGCKCIEGISKEIPDTIEETNKDDLYHEIIINKYYLRDNYKNYWSDHPLISSIEEDNLFITYNVEKPNMLQNSVNDQLSYYVEINSNKEACELEKNGSSKKYTFDNETNNDIIKHKNNKIIEIITKTVNKILKSVESTNPIKRIIISLQECYPSLYINLIKDLKFDNKNCKFTKLIPDLLYESKNKREIKSDENFEKKTWDYSNFCTLIFEKDKVENDIIKYFKNIDLKLYEYNYELGLGKQINVIQDNKSNDDKYIRGYPCGVHINLDNDIYINGIYIQYNDLNIINFKNKETDEIIFGEIKNDPLNHYQIKHDNLIEFINNFYDSNKSFKFYETEIYDKFIENKNESVKCKIDELFSSDNIKINSSDSFYLMGDFNFIIDHLYINNILDYNFKILLESGYDYIIKISNLTDIVSVQYPPSQPPSQPHPHITIKSGYSKKSDIEIKSTQFHTCLIKYINLIMKKLLCNLMILLIVIKTK